MSSLECYLFFFLLDKITGQSKQVHIEWSNSNKVNGFENPLKFGIGGGALKLNVQLDVGVADELFVCIKSTGSFVADNRLVNVFGNLSPLHQITNRWL